MDHLIKLEQLCAAARICLIAANEACDFQQHVLSKRWKLDAAALYNSAAELGIKANYLGEATAIAGLNAVELWYNCGQEDKARSMAQRMLELCCNHYIPESTVYLQKIASD